MADFALALPYVLKHEGGWSDDPDDPGGATNYGITLKTASSIGILTKEQLRAITPEQVAGIYKRDYWKFDALNSQRVATKLFDMCVNMGVRKGVELAQDGLNLLGASIHPDGLLGPITVKCINAVPEDKMLDVLCHEAQGRYLDIVAANPRMKKFLPGWMHRACEVPDGGAR